MSELNVKEMNFDRLFKQISPEEIIDNVFTLGFTVMTLPPQNVSLSELL